MTMDAAAATSAASREPADEIAGRIAQVRVDMLNGRFDDVYEQIELLLAQASVLPGQALQLRTLALEADLRRNVRPQLEVLAELKLLESQARELADPGARVDLHLAKSGIKRALCMHVQALDEVVAAVELCVSHGLVAALMRAVEMQGRVFLEAGMYGEATVFAQKWLAQRPMVPVITQISMWSLLGTTAYYEAEESGSREARLRSVQAHGQALALAGDLAPFAQSIILMNLTIGFARLGDLANAEHHFSAMKQMIHQSPEAVDLRPWHWAWLAYCEALVQLARGQEQAGRAALVAGREAAQPHRLACLAPLIKIQELLLMHPDPAWSAPERQAAARELARLHAAQSRQQLELAAKGFEEMVRTAELGGENRVLRQQGDELMHELALQNQALGETVAELRAQVQRRESAEAALQQAHDQLELRVIERTEQLQVAGLALAQHERMAALARLVAGVAHRLNTPLGNACMAISSLSDAAKGFAVKLAGPMTRRELVDYVKLNQEATALADHALHKASDLMQVFKQVSTLEHAETARSFDAVEIARQVAHLTAVSLGRTDLPLRLELPDQVVCFGFPQVFAQVLKQLLANAYLHGQPEPSRLATEGEAGVWLHLSVLDDELHVWVRDQGPGLSAAQLERIFDPFNTSLHGSGLGLGLHIARNLTTDLLHGQLRASSTLGAGCSFSLQIPRSIDV